MPIVRLGEICEINPPTDYDFNPEDACSFVPMEAVDDVDARITRLAIRPFREVAKGYTPFAENDVIVAKITPCMENGKCAIGRRLRGGVAFGSTEFHVLRATRRVIPEWLFYFWRFPPTRKLAAANMTGSAGQKRVPVSFLEAADIPLPEISEQRQIVGQLKQAEQLLRTRRYALELTDTFLPAVFREFFAVARSGAGHIVTLQEVADIITGYPFPSEQYVTSGEAIRLCRGANVLPGRIDWSDLAAWPRSKVGDFGNFILQTGDVLVAMDRPWISEGFKVTQVRPEDCPSLLVQRVARLRGKNGVPNSYLYYLLRQQSFTRHCRPTETTIPHISPTEIQTFSFQLPPAPLQQEFARLVGCVESLRVVQCEALRQAQHLFGSLLHRAFAEKA